MKNTKIFNGLSFAGLALASHMSVAQPMTHETPMENNSINKEEAVNSDDDSLSKTFLLLGMLAPLVITRFLEKKRGYNDYNGPSW